MLSRLLVRMQKRSVKEVGFQIIPTWWHMSSRPMLNRRGTQQMKEVFARFLNVITVIGLLLTVMGLYSLVTEGTKDIIWNGVGTLVFVFVVNYIFLGKGTVWNS